MNRIVLPCLAIRVNNIITQDLLSQRIFNIKVTSLKWFPSVVRINSKIYYRVIVRLFFFKFDDKSDGILAGFSDGVIRYLKLRSGMKPNGTEKKLEFDLRILQVLKPHTKPVTCIALEVKNQWIATGVCSLSQSN